MSLCRSSVLACWPSAVVSGAAPICGMGRTLHLFSDAIKQPPSLCWMSYLGQPELPRILMLDCTDDLIASVRRDGYNVEVGYTGFFEQHPEPVLPGNLHEKDVIIIDLEPSGWTPKEMPVLFSLGKKRDEVDHLRHPQSERVLQRFVPSFSLVLSSFA